MRSCKLLLSVALVMYSFHLHAQSSRYIDSLKLLISKAPRDSFYIKHLEKLSERYLRSNPDSTIKYASLIIKEPTIKFAPLYKKVAYNQLAYAYYLNGNYELAKQTYQQSAAYGKQINDTNHLAISIMNEGNVYIEQANYTKALEKYKQAAAIVQNTKYLTTAAQANGNMGYIYKEIGDYTNAEIYNYQSLRVAQKLQNKKMEADILNVLSVISLRKKNMGKALQFTEQAKAIQQAINDADGLAISNSNIANIYSETGDYAKAIDHTYKALTLFKQVKDKRQIALGYSTLANLYTKQNLQTKAILYYDTSLQLSKNIGNVRMLSNLHNATANAHLQLLQPILAKQQLDSSYKYLAISRSNIDRKTYYETEAYYYSQINNHTEALLSYKKFVALKDTLLNETNIKTMNNLNVQYETEKKELAIGMLSKSDSIKSLQIVGQQLAINESVLKITEQNLSLTKADLQLAADSLIIKNSNEIILQNQLDAQQKQATINLLAKEKIIQQLAVNKKNNTIIALCIGMFLLALTGFAFYKNNKTKQQAAIQAAIAKEQDMAVKGMIEAEEKERKRIAEELHDGIGQIMTAAWLNLSAVKEHIQFSNQEQTTIFNTSVDLVNESCKEVRLVSHNMMPNALVKKGLVNAVREFLQQINVGKISINLSTDGLNSIIPSHIEIVLYRIIQESVNNVIKHAQATSLDVSINQSTDGIDVLIEDNGIGFNTADKKDTDGIGLLNIKNRVHYLKGTVEWNSQPNNGTAVAIFIPFA